MRITAGLKRALCLTATLAVGIAWAGQDCRVTPEYARMEEREILLHLSAGKTERLEAKVADDPAERAAVFQHLCAQDIGRYAILFLFEGQVHAAFHMHNVHGPLDIAFLDGEGRVLELQRMLPYAPGAAPVYYRPARPFSAALETEAGRLFALKPVRVEVR